MLNKKFISGINHSTRWLKAPELHILQASGPTLESKGMGAFFQKKGKEVLKKSKIFENLGKNVQNLKIFL